MHYTTFSLLSIRSIVTLSVCNLSGTPYFLLEFVSTMSICRFYVVYRALLSISLRMSHTAFCLYIV